MKRALFCFLVVLMCASTNSMANELVFSPIIDKIFRHETIGVTVQYFDKKYGPAKRNDGYYKEYDIDGCKITVTGKNDVESISLDLNQQCNINMSRFLDSDYSAYGMTFGDFEKEMPVNYTANCFAGSCGNMLDASVDAYIPLPRSQNFLELKASVTINTESSLDASSKFESEISNILEPDDLLSLHTSFCSKKHSDIIKKHFENIKIDSITLGANLQSNCNEN